MSNVVRSVVARLSLENGAYIRGVNQSAVVTEQGAGRMQRAVRGAAVSTSRDWDTIGRYGRRAAIGAAGALALVVKTTADFSSEMALVRTLSHANATEMEQLSHAALTVGQNIGYSAKEVAQGEEEMIKAGVSVKDILGGGLKGALDLAAAGQTDVATATTIAASALTQFRLEGKDIPHVADLLSAGADKALGSVEDLGYGLEQAGTTAHQMGLSIEQTVGTLAAFAQAGLTGERGGTTLKQMLLQLAAPTSVAQKLMDKYGISLYKANGQIKTMPELADNLQRSLGKLTPAQRNAALGVIFGSRAIQGANILMADGREGIAKWIDKVNDQGFAAGQASGKLDSLNGDLKKLKATLSTTFIEAGSPSQKALRSLVQDADHLVRAFSELPDAVQQGVIKTLALTAAVGGTLYAISKIRNVARDLRGINTRGATGGRGLAGAASLAAPLPVYVVNLGPGGGLIGGGKGGKGGGILVAGEAGAAEKGGAGIFGRLKGFKLPAGTGIVATLGGLALMLTGTTDKTHTGSTVGGALAGGQILGIPGALFGGALGSLHDVYNAGGGADDALERAKKALKSGDIKQMQDALAGLRTETEKLATGGWGQNFARGVTEITGRRGEIEETGKALQEALDEKKYDAGMLWLVSGGRVGKPRKNAAPDPLSAGPVKDALATLLNPDRKGHKPPKPKTSEEVLADFYGVDPKKLKPVPLLDRILGVLGTNALPSPGAKHTKNGFRQFTVDLGLDTSGFDKNATHTKRTAKELDALHIVPNITVTGVPAAMTATAALKSLLDSLHDRSINVTVTKTTNATIGDAVANSGKHKTGADGLTVPRAANGWTVMGQRNPYGDKVLAYLAPGEEVITNRHGEADAFRRDRAAGRIPAYADGMATRVTALAPAAVIDYRQLASAVTGNQLLGHRSTRDALISAMRTVFSEMPVMRAPLDLSAVAGLS